MSERGSRHIWLCADDYGISPAVNGAIRDLIARRRINATSVMVAAPAFDRAAAAALVEAAASHAAIGLHLTMTAPFAPLSQGFAPVRDGAFLSLATTLRRAVLRRFNPARLATEMTGQFAAFHRAFDRAPDFVDGHQHVHLFPQFREALICVMKDAAPRAWLRQCGRAASARPPLAGGKAFLLDALSPRLRRLAAENGIRTNPAFAGAYAFRTNADYARLFSDFLAGMPDGGVIMCHPGTVDAELQRLDSLTQLREQEYAFFSDEAFPKLLAAHGVTLDGVTLDGVTLNAVLR
jgi:hypothetical protein